MVLSNIQKATQVLYIHICINIFKHTFTPGLITGRKRLAARGGTKSPSHGMNRVPLSEAAHIHTLTRKAAKIQPVFTPPALKSLCYHSLIHNRHPRGHREGGSSACARIPYFFSLSLHPFSVCCCASRHLKLLARSLRATAAPPQAQNESCHLPCAGNHNKLSESEWIVLLPFSLHHSLRFTIHDPSA